jgi:hypothetical protein
MSLTEWEENVVALFTEVSILEPLINGKVESVHAEGLGETGIGVLIMLSRATDVGISRASIIWQMEATDNECEAELDHLLDRGLIEARNGKLHDEPLLFVSNAGRETLDSALRALVPLFKPALENIDTKAIVQATETLREIRRTLDNLPD